MTPGVTSAASAGVAPPTFHKATLATDGTGRLFKGAALTHADAILERQAGRDVVVCGAVEWQNARWARSIEAAVGPCLQCSPHTRKAGPQALPHFHQVTRNPGGHCFFETAAQKAS
jgi:hypothetical protein